MLHLVTTGIVCFFLDQRVCLCGCELVLGFGGHRWKDRVGSSAGENWQESVWTRQQLGVGRFSSEEGKCADSE